jgi:tetratricopeptide (TPR) repeat protein
VETKGENCENIYVLDSYRGTVTVFGQTVFGQIVHHATALYNGGYYAEALDPWLEVLKRDGNYRRAYIGISSAYYNLGEYEKSMEYAKKADSSKRYNRAFERYRSQWLKAHLTEIVIVIAVLIAGIWAYRRFLRPLRKKTVRIKAEKKHEGGAAS